MSARATCVIKFGGTALATPRRVAHAAAAVGALLRRGIAPIVVCSANGHRTDRLLAWCHRVAPGAADDDRERDRVLATGEDASSALFTLALGAHGVAARSLRGAEAGLIAEGAFGAGRLVDVDLTTVRAWLDRGVVPVVSGFHATRRDGETVTLGRGASDLVAVALAAAWRRVGPARDARAGVPRIDGHALIVTDVDGVYEADPRRDPTARRYARLSHATLLRLAERGDQVVQAPAARLAAATDTPLLVSHFRRPLSALAATRVAGVRDRLVRDVPAHGATASGGR